MVESLINFNSSQNHNQFDKKYYYSTTNDDTEDKFLDYCLFDVNICLCMIIYENINHMLKQQFLVSKMYMRFDC